MKHKYIVMTMKPKAKNAKRRRMVKWEGFALCFLRLPRRGESWVLVRRLYDQQGIISWTYASFVWSNTKNTRICSKTWLLHHNNVHISVFCDYLVKNNPLSWLSYCIHRTWPSITFFGPKNWSDIWQDGDLLQFRR